jgi:alpha-galactosidase
MDTALPRPSQRAVFTKRLVATAIGTWALSISMSVCVGQPVLSSHERQTIRSEQVWAALSCGKGCLWKYGSTKSVSSYAFGPPTFDIDGKLISGEVQTFAPIGLPARLNNGVTQYAFEGILSHDSHIRLGIQLQINDGTPVVRFRYVLRTDQPRKLGMNPALNGSTYFTVSLKDLPDVKEVMLSTFAGLTHSYTLSEKALDERDFDERLTVMGPIVAAGNGHHSVLFAYEHGSQTPDEFLHFQLFGDRDIGLTAVKGNYLRGQVIDVSHPYQTIWFETAAVEGGMNELASSYRRFVLRNLTQNPATRQPYIFYNTWNFQERNKWWNGKAYLDSMNEDRILKEIDVAHRMGIDVFVLDTGWYEKTGDWNVSTQRFPDGLKSVKDRLDSYNMKLGLWFDPTAAAMSSKVVHNHPEWRMSWNGEIDEPHQIWETEKSYRMCLVSGYADAFADELIRTAKQVGVTYFKWDAIGQYGCNDPHHDHGTNSNTEKERSDSYAFQLVQSMSRIADRIAAAVPGAIIDFDVTEGDRAMGLGFLSSGKYFLINNGPYYQNYDVPINKERDNWNLFFYQGQARTWIARSPLTFDRWIPSILFLTHYFPDDPRQWQEVNVASLILGQNGLWGDLLGVSDSGIAYIADVLDKYRRVRDDVTESDPIVTGIVSGSPEIHEKVSTTTGRGEVVIFATVPGSYEYVTRHKVAAEHWTSESVAVLRTMNGNAKITATFNQPGAKIAFFGVQ